jgi:hypothetical protein
MKQPNRPNDVTTATRYNPDTTADPKWIGKYRAAILGGSLVFVGLMGVYGCTKKSEQSVAAMTANPSSTPTVPALALSAKGPNTKQPAAPKRIVQRRSPTATYANDTYGVSFRYPRNYKLQTWDPSTGSAKTAAIEESTADPAEVPLATVQMPQNLYPGTDFSDGYFSVSANRGLTELACQQSVITNEDSNVMKEMINGVEFHWTENSSTEGLSRHEWHSYAALVAGTCYEAQLGFEQADRPAADVQAPRKVVDSAKVFSRLQTILASLKIHPASIPAVETPARSFGESPNRTPGSHGPSIAAVNGEAICPKCESGVRQAYLVAGTSIDIVGQGFLPSNTVWIGSVHFAATSQQGSIRVLLPESLPVGTYALHVSNDSGNSDSVTVAVRPPAFEPLGEAAGPGSEAVMNAAKQQ